MRPLPVTSHRIMACRDTLAAGIATRWAGLFAGDPAEHVDMEEMPHGISVRSGESLPAMVQPLRAETIEGLHAEAVARAWRDGAWDINVSLHPPLSGIEVGLVTAHADYSADPGLADILVDAVERGRLVTWQWLPMRGGPDGRWKRHADKDPTLHDGRRDGPPPADLRQPNWSWRKFRTWEIRLGGEAVGPRPRPATVNQRGYLGRLLRLAGQSDRLPSRLSFDQASAWIDRLRGEAP